MSSFMSRKTVGEKLATRGLRRILVRLPASLLDDVNAEAESRGISQNAFVVDWLTRAVQCERDIRRGSQVSEATA